jgi:hypothetical protein
MARGPWGFFCNHLAQLQALLVQRPQIKVLSNVRRPRLLVQDGWFWERGPWSLVCTAQLQAASRKRLAGANLVRPAICTLQNRDEVPEGAFFLLFQRDSAKPSDFRRLMLGPKSVSEHPVSLSIRPLPKSRRIQKVSHFQWVDEIELRRS